MIEVMHDAIFIDKHLERTCSVVIQHLKNVILFQSQLNQSWGYHTRLMERMLHPEDKLIFRGTSKRLLQENQLEKWKEHIVPMGYLLNGLWELIKIGEHSDKELTKILKRNLGVAYITRDEAKAMDSRQYGLKNSMPKGWCLETGDPLDRLKVAKIILINQQGQEIQSLKDE